MKDRFTPKHLADAFAHFEKQNERVIRVILSPWQYNSMGDSLWDSTRPEDCDRLRIWGAYIEIRPAPPYDTLTLMLAGPADNTILLVTENDPTEHPWAFDPLKY